MASASEPDANGSPEGSDAHQSGESVRAYALSLAAPPARGVLDVLARAGHEQPLEALASALAASPPARTMPDVTLVVRERPEPLLVFVGDVDESAQLRLVELAGLLDEAGTRLRLISWTQVERSVERLADQVRQRLGSAGLADAALLGVPRGGLIVAGLLAYALGLPRQQVQGEADAGTLVLVDDCVLSGVRLRERLAATAHPRILVAALHAHPRLRAAIERAEPRVIAALAGEDLHDHAEALLGDRAPSWRETWSARVPQRYHTALTDLLAYPWAAPEVRLWNPQARAAEPHWWVAPPTSCLQHRAADPALPLHRMDDDPAARWLPPHVVALPDATGELLIDVRSQTVTRLAGGASRLWRAWLDHGDAAAAAAAVAETCDAPAAALAADLQRLLTDLSARDLLSARPPSQG